MVPIILRIFEGERLHSTRAFRQDVVLLGAAEADVILDGTTPLHAQIAQSESGVELLDLSCGATRLNGTSVEQAMLQNGDVVQVGRFAVHVELRDAAARLLVGVGSASTEPDLLPAPRRTQLKLVPTEPPPRAESPKLSSPISLVPPQTPQVYPLGAEEAVLVRVLWGDALIGVKVFRHGEFVLGETPDCDAFSAIDILGAARVAAVQIDEKGVTIAERAGAERMMLERQNEVTRQIGPLTMHVSRVLRPALAPTRHAEIDLPLLGFLSGAFVLLFCVLLGARAFRMPRRAGDHTSLPRPPVATHFLPTKAPKVRSNGAPDAKRSASTGSAQRGAQPEGELGTRSAPHRRTRAGGHAKKSDAQIVSESGLLKALSVSAGVRAVLSDEGLSNEVKGALGHLRGEQVADAQGVEKGLRGAGPGGGGSGLSTIGLSGVATRGRAGGQSGYGAAHGALKTKTDAEIGDGGEGKIVEGNYDRELVRQVVHAHRAQLRYCYEQELTRAPGLAGKISARWLIGSDGAVTQATVAESSMGNDAAELCVLARIRSWTFPKPKSGDVMVVYPFMFKQSG